MRSIIYSRIIDLISALREENKNINIEDRKIFFIKYASEKTSGFGDLNNNIFHYFFENEVIAYGENSIFLELIETDAFIDHVINSNIDPCLAAKKLISLKSFL